MDQAESKPLPPLEILMVTSPDSPEFSHFQSALRDSSVVALDAEWKPVRSREIANSSQGNGGEPTFPTVTLLQIACRVHREASDSEVYVAGNSPVFLVDLLSIPLSTIWGLLREMFVSPSVLKLGFRFKQDLVNLSSTFSSQGFLTGFDKDSLMVFYQPWIWISVRLRVLYYSPQVLCFRNSNVVTGLVVL